MDTRTVSLGALLILTACGGSAFSSVDPQPQPQPMSDAGAQQQQDAQPAPDATNVTPQIAKHCNVSPATPDVCIENAQGRAGETVSVEIHLVGDAKACNAANEAGGHILFDPNLMSVENPGEQISCRTRRVAPSIFTPGATVIQWDAFGPGTLGGCTTDIPFGKVDVVEMRILPGTKPGDYELKFEDASYIGYTAPCTNIGGGIAGTLRVLP